MASRKRNKAKPRKVDPTDPKYIEEQRYLNRWKGTKSAPSLFEKIDKDPSFEGALKGRTGTDPLGVPTEPSLGTQWGIGKPKGPN